MVFDVSAMREVGCNRNYPTKTSRPQQDGGELFLSQERYTLGQDFFLSRIPVLVCSLVFNSQNHSPLPLGLCLTLGSDPTIAISVQ